MLYCSGNHSRQLRCRRAPKIPGPGETKQTRSLVARRHRFSTVCAQGPGPGPGITPGRLRGLLPQSTGCDPRKNEANLRTRPSSQNQRRRPCSAISGIAPSKVPRSRAGSDPEKSMQIRRPSACGGNRASTVSLSFKLRLRGSGHPPSPGGPLSRGKYLFLAQVPP